MNPTHILDPAHVLGCIGVQTAKEYDRCIISDDQNQLRRFLDHVDRLVIGHIPPATGPGSSLHHIALSLPWDEQQAVIEWYENLGPKYYVETFDWVGWRGVFTFDPDGNTVELVAKDPNWVAS